MKVSRDFKGIWIPKEIWLDKSLTIQEKVFLAEIDSLEGEDGCFASNSYFMEFFGLSRDRIIKIIGSLVEKGYITKELIYKEDSKEVEKRILRVVYKPQRGSDETNTGGSSENTTDITKNNITKNISYNYKDVIDYLNEKAGKSFKCVEANNKLIRARYNEGYALEDFYRVIDYKVLQWKGNEWEKYLRPSTLFSAKNFENYLNDSPPRSIDLSEEVEKDEDFKNFMDIFKGVIEDEQ